jgi:hypothetical protein
VSQTELGSLRDGAGFFVLIFGYNLKSELVYSLREYTLKIISQQTAIGKIPSIYLLQLSRIPRCKFVGAIYILIFFHVQRASDLEVNFRGTARAFSRVVIGFSAFEGFGSPTMSVFACQAPCKFS